MKIHRGNLESYLFEALLVSVERDKKYLGENGTSIHTAAIRETLEAVKNGETLEYFQ